ncbi:MAG: hypothetical protein ACKO6N_01930 [Myxococcota bacterium]
MNTKHVVVALAALVTPLIINFAMAAAPVDFQGTYDLLYTRAYSDALMVKIEAPGRETKTIEVTIDETLENELLPYASADKVVAQVAAGIEQYRPQTKARIEERIMEGVEDACYGAVDQINLLAEALPDELALAVVNARTGISEAAFTDLDTQDSEPIVLRGAVLVEGGLGMLSFMPLFEGMVDPAANYAGEGGYALQNIKVSETVNGVTITVTGNLYLDMDIQRL